MAYLGSLCQNMKSDWQFEIDIYHLDIHSMPISSVQYFHWLSKMVHNLPTDKLFNLKFQFESVFNLEFQPKFGIQLGMPIPMGIHLGECMMGATRAKPLTIFEILMKLVTILLLHHSTGLHTKKKRTLIRVLPLCKVFFICSCIYELR